MKSSTKSGFTLLEMLIAIVIFSLISIYLYQTLSTLRQSNERHGHKIGTVTDEYTFIKVMFLDLALSIGGSVDITEEDTKLDEIWMQTSHTLHRRTLPYVGYIVRNGVLYRIESPRPPTEEEPLEVISYYLVDKLMKVEHFRVYVSEGHFLVDIKEPGKPARLFKAPGFNL